MRRGRKRGKGGKGEKKRGVMKRRCEKDKDSEGIKKEKRRQEKFH